MKTTVKVLNELAGVVLILLLMYVMADPDNTIDRAIDYFVPGAMSAAPPPCSPEAVDECSTPQL